jgi:hypothetical protein
MGVNADNSNEIASLGDVNRKIIFIASTANQIQMWTSVAEQLRRIAPAIAIELCSLDLYYGQIERDQLVESNLVFFRLPRRYSNVVYWDCNLYEKIRMYFDARLQVSAFFEKFSPDLLVFGNDIGLLEQILLTEGKRRDIPTLLIQDGILIDIDTTKSELVQRIQFGIRKSLRYFPRSIYGCGGAKKIAVMGPYSRRLFEKRGIRSDAIVETGHPRFDKLKKIRAELTDKKRVEYKHKAGFNKNLPVICFFTQPMIRYQYLLDVQKWDKIVRDVIGVVEELGAQFQFVIKLHPSELKEEFVNRYNDEIKESKVSFFHKEDVSDLLPFIDIAVVYNSTVSLEAMILDIPIIIYNPYDIRDDFRFIELGGAVIASNKTELKSAVLEFGDSRVKSLSSNSREQTVKCHAGTVDGYAGYRIATLVQNMVSAKGMQTGF